MRAHRSLGFLIATILGAGSQLAAVAAQPAIKAVNPRVGPAPRVAQSPRVAMAASTPATPVSTAQVGAVPGPGGVVTPPMTLWRFLGIPQGLSRVAGSTFNRRGNLPGLEPKPPLKALADPANLMSKNPAIKKAAEIKQEEDLAKQKIKALKYLAKMGCGCYPGVKEALIAALDDCTEKVRYEAAKQIGNAAENKCETCSKTCCCDAEMMQALWDKATKKDDNGCFTETSERVREAACEALLACRRRVPVEPAPAVKPYEGETIPERRLPPGETIPETPPANNETRDVDPTDALLTELFGIPSQPQRKAESKARIVSTTADSRSDAKTSPAASQRPQGAENAGRENSGVMLSGRVVDVDQKTATVDLEFGGNRAPTVGSRFSLHHQYAFETVHLGEVEVVYLAGQGRAIAKPVGKFDLLKVAKGDQASGRTSDSPTVAQPPRRPEALAKVKPSAEPSLSLHAANAAPAQPSPAQNNFAPSAKVEPLPKILHSAKSQRIVTTRQPAPPRVESKPVESKPVVVTAEETAVAETPNAQATIRLAPVKRVRRSAVIRTPAAAESVDEQPVTGPDVSPAENEKPVLRLTSGEQTKPAAADRRKTTRSSAKLNPRARDADEPRILEAFDTMHVSAPKASQITFAPPGHPQTKSPAKRQRPASDASEDAWVMIGD